MIKIALKNVVGQWRRYRLIFVAIALSFTLLSVLTTVTQGIFNTVREKAATYFAGDITITQQSGWRTRYVENPQKILASMETRKDFIYALRTVYYADDAEVIFNGNTIRQRRLVGLDWLIEHDRLKKMKIIGGSLEGMEGSEGIVISKIAAEILGAKIGDDVIVAMTPLSGIRDFRTFIVKAVFDEKGLFGFAAYVDGRVLAEALKFAPGACTDIAVFLPSGMPPNEALDDLRSLLSSDLRLQGKIETREQLKEWVNSPDTKAGDGALITLDAQLQQIKDLLDAITIIAYGIISLFVLIVSIAIVSFYRMLVRERIKEIGTMRAIGLSRRKTILLFVYEAMILSTLATIAGFAAGLGVSWCLSAFSLPVPSLFQMFLENGRLMPLVTPVWILGNALFILLAAVFAVLIPAVRAARTEPTEAMRA